MAPSTHTLKAAFPELPAADIWAVRSLILDVEDGKTLPWTALDKIDTILGNHGVESIPPGRGKRSPGITYSNSGDSYGTTVLYVNGRFRVGCWGVIVERGDYE